jgi:single-strand DNA-binding protein
MFNKAFLLGRVGKEVKLAYTKDECPVASFDMATNEYYKDKDGERVTATTWHKIVAYRNLAEICTDLLNKGSLVFIEGRINKRKWTDKDGNNHTATDIIASRVQVLDFKDTTHEDIESETPSAADNDFPL